MFGKLLKRVKQTEWLTGSVVMAMCVTNTYALQNHFVHVPFSKLMQQHGLVDAIATMNTLIAVVSIVAALVTMATRASWVKWVATIACLGSTSLILCYPWVLSQSDPTALYTIRSIQILLENILFGSVVSILRMVAKEDREPHKKTMALDNTLWAVVSVIAKSLGFWLMDDLQTWAVFATLINVAIIPLIWGVKIEQQNQKKETSKNTIGARRLRDILKSEGKQWGLALARQLPTAGNNVVFMLIVGGAYFVLFIDDKWLVMVCMGLTSFATIVGSWLSAKAPKSWNERIVIVIAGIISTGGLLYFYWVDPNRIPICTILVSFVLSVCYGAAQNSYGYLNNRCYHRSRKGLATGSGRLVFAGSGMICAVLFGVFGVHRDFWLFSSVAVAVTLAVLPLIKYPPYEDKEKGEDMIRSVN